MTDQLWIIVAAVIGGLFLLWLLVQMKTSRPDGTLVPNVHPYRRMMSHIMPTRNGSIVYYDYFIHAAELLRYLEAVGARDDFEANPTHCIVAAAAMGFAEAPTMNRFVVGHRLYQRDGIWITFSMKRQKLEKKAKLAVVKLELTNLDRSFAEVCNEINGHINRERSGKKTYLDRELALLTAIPRPVMALAFRVARWMDYNNLLPASFIRNDGMFTGLFIANLGSLGMNAAYHHLYEWGTCPLFMMVGRIEERPVVIDGELAVAPVLHVRYGFDERVDDGLTARFGMDTAAYVLEDPFNTLRCTEPDGSDDLPLSAALRTGDDIGTRPKGPLTVA